MKVLHVSDLHIGKRVNGMSMLDDQRYILRQILDIAEKHQVSVLLIAGDVYKRQWAGRRMVLRSRSGVCLRSSGRFGKTPPHC